LTTAAALAVLIANRSGYFIPLSILILPIAGAVAAWLVEHILILTTGKHKARQPGRLSSISAYLFGFLSLVALDLLAIVLYSRDRCVIKTCVQPIKIPAY
jgi:hypothetical protein